MINAIFRQAGNKSTKITSLLRLFKVEKGIIKPILIYILQTINGKNYEKKDRIELDK